MRRHLGTCRHADAISRPAAELDLVDLRGTPGGPIPSMPVRRLHPSRVPLMSPPAIEALNGTELSSPVVHRALLAPPLRSARAKGERNQSCRLQEACLSLQGRASETGDKASRNRRHTHGTRAAVARMGVVIWILLALAYAWSVRKLARMGRAPDPWSSGQSPSSDALHIELVHAEEKRRKRRPATQPQQRLPAVALPRR
jgi:hypothetical protein